LAARDKHNPAWERTERNDCCDWIRRFGIIVVSYAAALANEFKPVLDTSKRAERLKELLRFRTCSKTRSDGR
jgi:hypothetical protein